MNDMKMWTCFNPDHPDADWSGFIRPCESKKHQINEPAAMKVHITYNKDAGIAPNDDAVTYEWSKPNRRMRCEGYKDSGCSNTLIGGPVPENDPDSFSSMRWETESQAASRRLKTNIDQLTCTGRSMHVRSKRGSRPAFENVNEYNSGKAELIRRENPYLNSSNLTECKGDHDIVPQRNDGTDLNNLIGYRSHHGGIMKSFLSGLSKEVATDIYQSNTYVSSAPFATDGDLPTDPYYYTSCENERRKDLLLENFSSTTPGYTGKREFL